MTEDVLFKRVLVKARAANHNYDTSTRYQVAGHLLDANVAGYQRDALGMLLADAETYGVSIFGNSATIGKTPMINILLSSPNSPNCVLDVVYCTKNIMAAGKKDVWYTAKQFLHLVEHIDPHTKILSMLLLLMEHTMSKKQMNF